MDLMNLIESLLREYMIASFPDISPQELDNRVNLALSMLKSLKK